MGNHLGSYNGGHYNAISLNKETKENQNNSYEFTCYDDTMCYTMNNTEKDILINNKEAYILFYQLIID